MEYYSAIKKNKKEWNNTTFGNIDGPMDYHSKWNESEKDKYCIISLICGI